MRCSIVVSSGRVLAIHVVAITIAACAVGSPPRPNPFTDTSAAEELDAGPRSPNVIQRGEILSRGGNDHTAMAVIRRLRPNWLIAHGQKSFTDPSSTYPTVYIDEIRHGGLPTLHRIPSSEILRMEYYSTADATTRWGTGHPSGVINIVTGR